MTNPLAFDPNDLIQHIGEAMGLMLIALAEEHDAPIALLAAMQRAVQQCRDHPTLYSPETAALVRYAAASLEGRIAAVAAMRGAPN
jgi:hypothetical protein